MTVKTDSIAGVFARLGKDTKADAAFLKRIHDYERAFVSRSSDHLEFFGGNLMGVHPIRFRTTDRDDWFSDVLQIDELEVREQIGNLESINADWKRAADAMNHSCIWALHLIHHSKELSNEQKHNGMIDVLLVLQYKFLCSLMAHNYRYPADKATMEAMYASLSRKFSLKQAGSWGKLLQERARDVIAPNGIWRHVIVNFGPDKAVIEMIHDIQGRLRKIVVALNKVFYDVRAAGAKIGTEKSILTVDGETFLKDKKRHYQQYLRYIHEVLDDPRSFIRKELVDIVCDLQHTVPPRQLEEALEWMSINHREVFPKWHPPLKEPYVEHFVNEVLLHAFSLMSTNPQYTRTRADLGPLLSQLRALYMASRMADPALLKCKEMADQIVAASISSRNASVAASVRTAIETYTVLRALTQSYYTQ